MEFVSKQTIRGQIFRSFTVVAFSLFALSSLSIYALFSSREVFVEKSEFRAEHDETFFKIRNALEKVSNQYGLIIAGKGKDGIKVLEVIRITEGEFVANLKDM